MSGKYIRTYVTLIRLCWCKKENKNSHVALIIICNMLLHATTKFQCHTHSRSAVKWPVGTLSHQSHTSQNSLFSAVTWWHKAFFAGVYNPNTYLSQCWFAGRIKVWWEAWLHMAAHAAPCQHWITVTTPRWRGCFEQPLFWIHLNRFLPVMALSKGCRPATSPAFKGFSPK